MLLEGSICRSELLGKKALKKGSLLKHLQNEEKPTNQPIKKDILKDKNKRKTKTKNS